MSHSGKRKVNSQHCSTNEHETNSKKSCKDKKRVSGIFAVMMSNGRHLAKNMDRFQVESAASACYFCGCTENLHECHSCRSVVCYLRSGCSMLNSSDESMLYCLDCLWVLLCTCFCFTCVPKRGAFLPHERYFFGGACYGSMFFFINKFLSYFRNTQWRTSKKCVTLRKAVALLQPTG